MAKCLGSLDGVVLLSECNPSSAELFSRRLNPFVQMRNWYPALFARVEAGFDESQMQHDDRFQAFLLAVYDAVEAEGGHLIVRDYNYIDYFGVPFTQKPALELTLVRALRDRFEFRAVVLVRHPLDQYGSLRSHRILKDVLSPDIFLDGYEQFLSDVGAAKFVTYEHLLASPAGTLRDLCDLFGLRYDERVPARFHHYRSVTGNLSRDAEAAISPSRRTPVMDFWMRELQERPAYRNLLVRLGYGDR